MKLILVITWIAVLAVLRPASAQTVLPPDFHTRLGDLYFEYRAYGKAAEAYESALDALLPGGPTTRLRAAVDGLLEARRAGKQLPAAAAKLLECAGKTADGDTRAFLFERAAHAMETDDTPDLAGAEKALQQAVDAMAGVTDARSDPEAAARKSRILRGLAMLRQENNPDADVSPLLRAVIPLTDDFAMRMQTRKDLARRLSEQAARAEIARMRARLTRDDGDAEALETLAALYSLMPGYATQAAEFLGKLREAHPQDASIAGAYAEMLATAGDTKKATAELERLLALDPRKAQLYALPLARLHVADGNREAALKTLAAVASPGTAQRTTPRQDIRLGDLCTMADLLPEAATAYRTALAGLPEGVERDTCELKLARTLVKMDDARTAVPILERLAKEGKSPTVREGATGELRRMARP